MGEPSDNPVEIAREYAERTYPTYSFVEMDTRDGYEGVNIEDTRATVPFFMESDSGDRKWCNVSLEAESDDWEVTGITMKSVETQTESEAESERSSSRPPAVVAREYAQQTYPSYRFVEMDTRDGHQGVEISGDRANIAFWMESDGGDRRWCSVRLESDNGEWTVKNIDMKTP